MTYEIEQKLSKIFPWLDATQFDCDDGWQWIIVAMLKEIDDYYFDLDRKCYIDIWQAKEKFGALTIYWGVCAEEDEIAIANIFNKYEQLSKSTCEICGAEGKLIKDEYWISVRCEECRI